jgi:hypothetical protein
MADKIEYSRMLVKRTAQTGEVPTIPPITATTLNQMIPTDLFVGELFLNEADDLLWIRTDNGILPISLSGSTGSTPSLTEVLFEGNVTNGYNIEVSSGDTIIFQGIPSGVTSTILGLDASGNTITTTGGGGSQDLESVLSNGNTTGIFDIVISTGQTIQYLNLSSGSTNTILGLDASGNTITTSVSDFNTFTTGGTISYTGSTGVLDLFDNSGSTISITGLTDVFSTGGTYSAGTLTIDKNDGTSFNVSGLFTGYTSIVESLTTGTGLSGDTTTGNITIINTAPDQVVSLSGGTGITTGGTYPNFTITNSLPDQVVSLSGGTGITTGGTYPNFTITNSLPDQVVSLSGGTNISVSGTYPNFSISTTGLTSPSLDEVLSVGNTTNGNDIIVSTGDTISSPNGENEISLQDADQMVLKSTYTLVGNNLVDEIKMRAPSGSDAGLEIISTDNTNTLVTKSEYRPTSKKDLSFDSGGAFVETRLESSGFTIDLSNTSAGYLTIDGLLPGTSVDLLGLDSNNRVVPVSTSGLPDIFSTGGTFSAGTITINRNDNNSFNITGITAGVSSVNVGTGLSGNSTTGDITLINTAPDQVVSISGGTGITTGGTYPNFTITNSLPDQVVSISGGTNISSTGTYPNFTIAATGLTDYFVTGGTFSTSGGTLTLERNDGNDVTITGFTANVGCLGITIDGGGSAITTGVVGSIIVPYNCVIDCWGIIADQSGSIVIDVWKGSSPLSIPTSAAQSIAGSEKPTLSSQQINTDLNLTTWTTNLVFGDVLVFNVDSATTVERVTLQIKVIKL